MPSTTANPYRLILRGSVIPFVLALVVTSFLEATSIWDEIQFQAHLAWRVGPMAPDMAEAFILNDQSGLGPWLFKMYNCSFATLYLSPFFMLFLAGPGLSIKHRRPAYHGVSMAFWASALIGPLTLLLMHLPEFSLSLSSGGILAWFATVFHLSVGAFLLAAGVRSKKGDVGQFYFGSYPLFSNGLGLGCLLAFQIYNDYLYSAPGAVALMAFLLAIAWIACWLAWWRPIIRDCNQADS